MKDSCKPSKLEPGLAATYSTPRSRRVWTMRSEPGRVMARVTAGGRTLPASRSICVGDGGGAPADETAPVFGACASTNGVVVASAAAPAAAFFKKPRRPREFFGDFAMIAP